MLRRSPGFSVLVAGVLALGIGANAALFSIIDRVILHPFPYRDSGRMVEIAGRDNKRGATGVSPAGFNVWAHRIPAFDASAIWTWRDLMLTGVDDPQSLWTLEVSLRTFEILGVPPVHGRLFKADDFRSDAAPVAIIGYQLWQRQFQGNPALVGRQILLDQQSYTVIGIMGPEFWFNQPGLQLWIPLNPFHTIKEELSHGYHAMARLRPGATEEQAQREMDALAPEIPTSPGEPPGWRAVVRPYADSYTGEYRRALYVLWGAVLLVLLIACANAANLLLTRYSNRRREFAIRASLGAGRLRLVRQLLGESLTLAAAAGVAGIALAELMLLLLVAAFPEPVAFIRPERLALTAGALLITLGAVFATTVLCALPGCWHLWRSNLSATLHASTRGASADRASNRTRSVLVATEFALSVALLIGAGLMLQSFLRLMRVPLGFNPDHVLTAKVSAPPQLKYKAQIASYFDRVLAEAASIPGARSSAVVTLLPLGNLVATTSFQVEDQPRRSEEWHDYSVRLRSVSTRYFETMGVRLLRGRAFDERDTGKSPGVAIVNEDLARHYWPGQDPVGKHVSRSDHPKAGEWLTVVGVIESARDSLRTPPTGELYRPLTQDTIGARWSSVVVRTSGDPLSIAAVLRKRIHAMNPDQPVTDIKTMDMWVLEAVAQPRFNAVLLEVFAVFAFVLAVSGVFAAVSYSVTQRTHEIGIRSAVGATARDIAAFVVRLGLRPALAGAAIGVAGALAGARALQSQLFDTPALDPAVFAIVIPLLLGAAVAASLLPARRAVRIDPAVTLRSE